MNSFRARNFGLAALLAGAAGLLVAWYVTSYRSDVESGANLVSVLVAARDIDEDTAAGSLASSGFLRTERILKRSLVPGAVTRPEQLKGLVAAQDVYAGEQVSTRQFRPARQTGVQGQIARNMRALVVPGDATQLLVGKARAGDRVDVVANVKFKVRPENGTTSGERSRVASRVVLRDLLVLEAATPVDSRVGGGASPYSLLLAVRDAQMDKLFFALKNGEWSFALRPVATPEDSPESVETIESFLADGLHARQVGQLTGGSGRESLSNGQ